MLIRRRHVRIEVEQKTVRIVAAATDRSADSVGDDGAAPAPGSAPAEIGAPNTVDPSASALSAALQLPPGASRVR